MSSPKSSFCFCLFVLLLAAKYAVEARNRNTLSNIYEANLRQGNPPHQHQHQIQFHRRAKNDSEDEDDNDCSVELSRDGMSRADVKRSAVAATLSSLVYKLLKNPLAADDPRYVEVFRGQDRRGIFYESGIDAVYAARIRNEYCVAAFRGTYNRQDDPRKDWESNFDIEPVEFSMEDVSEKEKKSDADADSMCDMHSGYHNSYFNFEYRLSVEDFLQTCSEKCPECDVVLTGHSQGGGIAEVAALYYKKARASPPDNLYVITFGAPQGLGAGCAPLFAREERCRFYRYIMTVEGTFGRGLVYDPVPMVSPRYTLGDFDNDGILDESESSDSYARHGGLAYLGHEIFLNDDHSSALALGPFDGHYNVGSTKYDLTLASHQGVRYMDVLVEQSQGIFLGSEKYYDRDDYDCYLPTDGFPLGARCNKDESDLHCASGVSECERGFWLWSENTCQFIDGVEGAAWDRFCHRRPPQWTMVP